MQCTVKPV